MSIFAEYEESQAEIGYLNNFYFYLTSIEIVELEAS